MESGHPVGGVHAPEDGRPSRRFDSWKEIAAHFGRDVRTVRRWERSEALPVHRHLHRSRGSVYAFEHELDRWLASRSAPLPASTRRSFRSPQGYGQVAGLLVILGFTGWTFVLNDGLPVPSRPHRTATAPAATTAASAGHRLLLADAEAQRTYLLARHQLQRRAGQRQQALDYLEATIRRAPEFAGAHALLGEAYLRQALYDPTRRADAWQQAENAARRALALDEDLAAAHTVLARILLLRDWNWPAAAAEIQRAIELDPDDPEARSARALYLRSAGRLAEAIAERELAQRADPLNPVWLTFLGDEHTFARRYEDAIGMYERALEIERDYRPAVASLADVHERLERHADAAAWRLRSLTLRGETDAAAAFAGVSRREGPRAALAWLDRRNLVTFSRGADAHLWDLAYTHARLGNRDTAFAFLHRAYDRREAGLLQARVDPDLDPLRGDRRFDDLLQRIGPR